MNKPQVDTKFNFGTITTIAIFIIAQTIAGVVLVSRLSERVDNVASEVAELKAEIETSRTELDNENLRQWTRINQAERAQQETAAESRALRATLESVQENTNNIRADIRELNTLLRELYRTQANGRGVVP